MHLTFYTTSSAPDVLDKDLSQIGSAEALAPTSQVTILNPILVVDYDSSLLAANYAYIDTFKRYYWINIAIDTAGRLIVSCNCDPLMSWKNSIKSCPACIIRKEDKPTYVIDKKLPVDENNFFTGGFKFPRTPFTNSYLSGGGYVLITR